MNIPIYFAPLQSYTTLPYFLAFESLIGGVSKYFTPFYRVNKEGGFGFEKQLFARPQLNITPQVLTNQGDELLSFAREMEARGFDEINLNVGCPFPMLTNRKLGSGLLPYPDMLRQMLTAYFNADVRLKLSIKLRLGLVDTNEIYAVMEVLSDFRVEEIILHPRIGVQQYKGEPNWEAFKDLSLRYSLVGNGDINSMDILDDIKLRFPDTPAWMLGRGLLTNPCLLRPELEWRDTMIKLHDLFLNNLKEFGLSDHQILNQLKCFWEYPAQYLEKGQRELRKMKKVGSMEAYEVSKIRLIADS